MYGVKRENPITVGVSNDVAVKGNYIIILYNLQLHYGLQALEGESIDRSVTHSQNEDLTRVERFNYEA